MRASEVRGLDVLLLIEVAETSVRADLKEKATKYREHGVREYWVVDLPARVTHVHRHDASWPVSPPVPFDAPLAPVLLPNLPLRFADAEFG